MSFYFRFGLLCKIKIKSSFTKPFQINSFTHSFIHSFTYLNELPFRYRQRGRRRHLTNHPKNDFDFSIIITRSFFCLFIHLPPGGNFRCRKSTVDVKGPWRLCFLSIQAERKHRCHYNAIFFVS